MYACDPALTVSQELQQRQVNRPLPSGRFGQCDAVAGGGKDLPTANGHQLAALVLPSHVVQDGRVIDEGVQLPAGSRIILTSEILACTFKTQMQIFPLKTQAEHLCSGSCC